MPRNQGTSRKGKPKKAERAAGMGRALQRSQRGHGHVKAKNKLGGMSVSGNMAAPSTTSLDNVAETKNMSLLELDHLDDFLGQAEMAGREFESEKARYVVLDSHGSAYQPGKRNVKFLDQQRVLGEHEKVEFSFEDLSLPRRPKWDETTTPQELEKMENEAFLAWRRAIAAKEEELFAADAADKHAYYSRTVTPYEKNLHVWRQLWRVLERSNCICQVVDARNVNFYLSEDLKRYAKSLGKPMLLIVNKSDYLSAEQRRLWSEYLNEKGWEHVFFSAHAEQAKLDKAAHDSDDDDDENDKEPTEDDNEETPEEETPEEDTSDEEERAEEEAAEEETPEVDEEAPEKDAGNSEFTKEIHDEPGYQLLDRQGLTDYMLEFAKSHGCEPNPRYDNRYQFGTVGFPNVGKSSVINVLMGSSKNAHGVTRVGVAAQPGKTKHFQTLLLPERDNMMLCDCPGLVFPSFVSNTADLIAAGVYPIAQMRDHWPVMELICQRIPREIINASYGIKIPEPSSQELNERGLGKSPPPTAEEFLTTYCVARSMLAASSGVPDHTRASRIVVKDYVSGKLLFCHPPPNVEDIVAFHLETVNTAIYKTEKLRKKLLASITNQQLTATNETSEEHQAMDKEAEFDDNLLDILGGGDSTTGKNSEGGGKRGKAHKSKKKWGKKGRKLRDDDPYGCHKDPDEMLGKTGGGGGLVVKAGKYGRSGYVRPTSYGGARSAGS
ncbi:subunit GTPase 1 homolog [Seminavis robusta]|uniref:Subunit GTPase 1 homolog n=1 Tax=Seminavis robusta TaxID=568900 RepID=A0A9N8ETG7_9STRA|nr:subunit GTPase 1 homolog [Seminavis robusta]|eukprot:Sro1917_g305310.1 subunit GTPase 1 homolog (722) ;mRNA; r:6566-8836